MNVINRKMYKKTVALINTKSDDKVMDIGYGNGYLLKYLYQKTKSDLYGVDISEDMLKLATKRNKEACCLLNQYCLLLEKYCKGKKFCGNIY